MIQIHDVQWCVVAGVWLTVAGLLMGTRASSQTVPYGVPDEPWEVRLGNHRARVSVSDGSEAVRAHLPWRRRDHDPETKRIIVVDAATGDEIADAVPARLDRESGDIVFRPASGAGEYRIYYLPYTPQDTHGWYAGDYLKPEDHSSAEWRGKAGLDGDRWRELPQAEVLEFQARTEFSRLDPMKVIATASEVEALLEARSDQPYLLFPENRRHPIWMPDDLPHHWIDCGPSAELTGEACRNEFYAFQIGLYATGQSVDAVDVTFSDLNSEGASIPASALRCINLGGTDWTGDPLTKQVDVPQGRVQAMWCGVLVPPDAVPGAYSGAVTVSPANAPASEVALRLTITEELLEDHGDDDLWRFARLRWLDSTIGMDDDVVEPYTPLEVSRRSIRCLGREVRLSPAGLPERIHSGGRPLLADAARVTVNAPDGATWEPGDLSFTKQAPGVVEWSSDATADGLRMSCEGRMEFDGHLLYTVRLSADETVDLADVALELPLRKEAATYLMGIGHDGGRRPDEWAWKWGQSPYFDSFWLGDVYGGLQLELRGASYSGPMVNLYWNLGQLSPPGTWHNDGAGGCTIAEDDSGAVVARAYTGARRLEAGEELTLEFALLITPVRPLDSGAHFRARYHHNYEPVSDIAETGANVVNIHHANALNPYINYPFLTRELLSEYVREAHEHDIKVKLYYTLRELTNHVHEMPALRSLGHEILAPGGGAGYPWLREHLGSDYAPMWYSPQPDGESCAAVVNSGESRWYNYYLEGLAWLADNTEIDGLYLDDVSFDRRILKRVRKILKRQRPGSMIDLHSNTGFSFQPANQYMEFFPYIDRLWFGESFDYDREPDYWLTEISGIPFGLMGEMLQNGGNRWRGMVYGMTAREPWTSGARALWPVWDEFGIDEARMLGYWEPDCPVDTGRENVLATAYVREGRAMVAVATWDLEPSLCALRIDWDALGINPDRATLWAPEIEGYQEEFAFAPDDELPFLPGRGWLLIIDEESRDAPRYTGHADAAAAARELAATETLDGDALPEGWTARVSEYAGTGLSVTDGAVRIHCEAHRAAFIERELPAGVTMVSARLDAGSDGGESWGIGVGLAWADRFARINIRANEGRAGVDIDGEQFLYSTAVGPHKPTWLRIRLDADEVGFDLSSDGEWWWPIHSAKRERQPADPAILRVGKTHPHGDNADAGLPSAWGDSLIDEVRIYRD